MARSDFEGPDGQRSLLELFDGRRQLILYRFFFEDGVDGWPDAGCPGCSSVADGVPELGLLHARDITDRDGVAGTASESRARSYRGSRLTISRISSALHARKVVVRKLPSRATASV